MKQILVLVGGSGTGKTTIVHELVKEGFVRLITTTTRPMRKGEVDRIDYNFVTRDQFDLLDKVEENEYAGNMYGLTTEEIERKLKVSDRLVIVVDINGARALQKHYPKETKIVFIKVTKELMIDRLRFRGSSESEVQERLEEAERGNEYNVPKGVDLVIENNVLSETVKEIVDFSKAKTN